MPETERHAIAILVDNEPGILARVVGLFSGRGYNIESLTVAEVDRGNRLSRITIVTSGTRMIIEQIKAQLSRLVPVHKVHDLSDEGPFVEREMMLVKVAGKGDARIECLRLADIFRARVVELDDRELCLRDDRLRRKAERLCRADGAVGARRDRPDRRGGDVARAGQLLAEAGSPRTASSTAARTEPADRRRSHRPVKTGRRFSTKARAASRWSSVIAVRAWWTASMSSTVANGSVSAANRFRFI